MIEKWHPDGIPILTLWWGMCGKMIVRAMLVVSSGTAVAQWLRCCATNQKVAGLIPDGVIGILH